MNGSLVILCRNPYFTWDRESFMQFTWNPDQWFQKSCGPNSETQIHEGQLLLQGCLGGSLSLHFWPFSSKCWELLPCVCWPVATRPQWLTFQWMKLQPTFKGRISVALALFPSAQRAWVWVGHWGTVTNRCYSRSMWQKVKWTELPRLTLNWLTWSI